MRPTRFRTEWLWLAALLLLVSLHFWFPPLGTGALDDTYSTTAEGKKAFFLLVQEWGRPRAVSVERNLDPLPRVLEEWQWLRSDDVLCLLGPARSPTDREWDALLDWVASGGRLLIAAPHDRAEWKVPRLEIEVERTGSDDRSGVLTTPLLDESDAAGLHWKSNGRVLADGAETLVAWDGTVQAVAESYGLGTVVVVATDFPFSNESLAWGEHGNSVLALRLLEAAGIDPELYQDIHFDESLNATGTPKVVGLLLQPPLRPLTVQLLIGVVLFGWLGSRRFGPLLPQAVTARHNIVDHTDAVGALYYRSRNGAPALRSYLRQLLAELGLRRSKGRENRILEPLARRLDRPLDEVRQLLQQAAQTARQSQVGRKSAAALIRQLAGLRQGRATETSGPRDGEG